MAISCVLFVVFMPNVLMSKYAFFFFFWSESNLTVHWMYSDNKNHMVYVITANYFFKYVQTCEYGKKSIGGVTLKLKDESGYRTVPST